MQRKTVLALALALGIGSITAPLTTEAQPTGRVYRIGVLSVTTFDGTTLARVMAQALSWRGYAVGRDIVIEDRSAEGNANRLPALALELVNLKVDLIVAGAAVAIRAARDATATIPIVMAFSGEDPVKSGFVASLRRPGGNVTGVTAVARDLAPKTLELLRDAVPGLARVAVLVNPGRPEHAEYLRIVQAVRPEGLELRVLEAERPDQYGEAFATMTRQRAEGLVIFGDVMFTRDSKQLAELARLHALPSAYLHKAFAVAGGLMAYGPDLRQLLDLAADYIDKILNGENPGALAVQQPTRFRLALNIRAAKALGLTIPQSLLLRVDDLIE